MASHMGVQTLATERNSKVEFLVHFILEKFFMELQEQNVINNVAIESQKLYLSEISSDVWDHFISGVHESSRMFEIWCQTTCYKGNGAGTPEPNKTYEVRETLVEGLSIRQLFNSGTEKDYRSIHFTVGDSNYTYQWFLDLKAACYDKSIYIGKPNYDIFKDISAVLDGCYTEEDKRVVLERCVSGKSILGGHIEQAQCELRNWWIDQNYRKSTLADLQSSLITSRFQLVSQKWPEFSQVQGQDIKGRVNGVLFASELNIIDPLISRTAAKLLEKKPFLSTATQILASWENFTASVRKIAQGSQNQRSFIEALWSAPLPERLVIRRLLLRFHTLDPLAYVQDKNVLGVTEHNIYSGEHTIQQTRDICNQIESDLKEQNISTTDDVLTAFFSRGKQLINQAKWFEAKNGTELKPSFCYVQLALEDAGFEVTSPSKAGIKAIGYHSEITQQSVRPYTNLKVVKNTAGKAVCLLKAKFFRIEEFPRRCKEEAFVGLTLNYGYACEKFSRRLNIPLVMFVDMPIDCKPPIHAVKRLISFGWQAVFSTDELINYLSSESGN